jgi:hypothetical protein
VPVELTLTVGLRGLDRIRRRLVLVVPGEIALPSHVLTFDIFDVGDAKINLTEAY